MNDTDRYPLYILQSGKLTPVEGKPHIFGWQWHHFVEKKLLKKYPHLIEHQKLIYMPADCNYDIERRTRNFKTRWGIGLEEVVYKR